VLKLLFDTDEIFFQILLHNVGNGMGEYLFEDSWKKTLNW